MPSVSLSTNQRSVILPLLIKQFISSLVRLCILHRWGQTHSRVIQVCHVLVSYQNTHQFRSCQQAVLNELVLGPNIAQNTALTENVFMMVVCIELRIPLFVVGKPGSSKSLAKTVVADNMQGQASRSELFKSFKQVRLRLQCSSSYNLLISLSAVAAFCCVAVYGRQMLTLEFVAADLFCSFKQILLSRLLLLESHARSFTWS